MKQKKTRRFLAALSVLVLFACVFSGCSHTVKIENRSVVITERIKTNELLRIGNETITAEEARLFLMSEKNRIISVYGKEIFDQEVDGVPFTRYMDEELKAFLVRMAQIACMANDNGITLNNTEQDRVEQAANEFYRSLTTDKRSYTGATLDTVLSAYRHYYLMQKVLNNIELDLNLEISDDEARVITVQQIFVSRYETAEEVLQRAEEGTSFERLGSIYNEASVFKRTISRGELSDTYENAVFSLSNDAISTIFHENDGYYIVKCLNNYEMDLTMANKKNLAQEKVTEEFEKRFADFLGTRKLEMNEDAWQLISFAEDMGAGGENFFAIYDTYF